MEKKYIEIKAYGSAENLSRLVQVLRTIQILGGRGSTRTLELWVDGDGAAQMSFDFGQTDVSGVEIPDVNRKLRFDFE